MSSPEDDSVDNEVHITYDDQQKINKFSQCNVRLEYIKDELKSKENDVNNIGDAEDELMLALEQDEKVPYLLGEVFILKSQESATERLCKEKESIKAEIVELKNKASELEATMTTLKAELYAKFGTNINLETDDD